ncbi:hypothetical protein glysoja_033692 [Glycine soja]|uniref:Myb/SANT-like domain-containing protein n=1 Tax=Glycine soja TaxID=3848 RepID=A0A0B2QPN7_GLYSO|nr:hypothetical protein glysoja_033692 [Glycine soja]
MEWSAANTKTFIKKFMRVKNGQLQGSTFKTTTWEEINKDLFEMIQTNYGVDKLKSKFNRLRQIHRDFSTLLARTGVTWEMESNKVNALDEVWDELIKKGRHYKNFKKHGFEYDYDILGDIFNSSTTTGKLSHASTQDPPNFDEERAMEGDFLTKGIHINVSDDDIKVLRHKRKEIFSSGEHRRKEGKTSNKEMLDKIVSVWSDSMSQRTTTSRAREERYKGKTSQTSQATSPISDPYSVKACMELLDNMQNVPTSAYFKLMEKFTSEHWRQMFIVMDAERRKQLIESLVEHWRQMFTQSVYVMCLNLFSFIVVCLHLLWDNVRLYYSKCLCHVSKLYVFIIRTSLCTLCLV